MNYDSLDTCEFIAFLIFLELFSYEQKGISFPRNMCAAKMPAAIGGATTRPPLAAARVR